jgi:hypothetical protein
MSDPAINHHDIERIARKMERLSSQLSASERAILTAVIALASAAIGPAAGPATGSVDAGAATESVAMDEPARLSASTEKVLPVDAELSIEDQMRASFTPGAMLRSGGGGIMSVKLEP